MARRDDYNRWRAKNDFLLDKFNREAIALAAFSAGMCAGRRAERRKVEALKAEIRDIYRDLFPKADVAKIFRKLS
jgi:hypothetical protein